MLIDGFRLMVVGMGTVFLFLILLYMAVIILNLYINRFAPESAQREKRETKGLDDTQAALQTATVAAIAAALRQYRRQHGLEQ